MSWNHSPGRRTSAWEGARRVVKDAFDSLHQKVYGQSAPNENPEIITFRLQSEIAVPRLALPELPRTDGKAARAIKGQRPLYDTAQQKFERVNVWDRAKLLAGDRLEGPAIIEQFDATTAIPPGWRAIADGFRNLILSKCEA